MASILAGVTLRESNQLEMSALAGVSFVGGVPTEDGVPIYADYRPPWESEGSVAYTAGGWVSAVGSTDGRAWSAAPDIPRDRAPSVPKNLV